MRGRDRRARRVVASEWSARVGAERLAGRDPRYLSGGERQRVAVARALAGDPRVLLLDEPFSALDHPARRELRQLVRHIVDERRMPALLVTHDRTEADELADALIVFDHGRIAAVDVRRTVERLRPT